MSGERLVRDESNLTVSERRHRMIHSLQEKTVKVDKVSRHMEIGNLTFATPQRPHAHCHAPDQHARLRGSIPFANKLLAATKTLASCR